MKRTVLLTTFALFCPVCVFAAPLLKVADPVWNAGNVIAGKEYRQSFLVENAGDEVLEIREIEQCCGFFGQMERMRLAPGERTELRVRLKPLKMVGDLGAEIYLHSNDPRQGRFPVSVFGNVLPQRHALGELTGEADFVDLGVMLPGERVNFSVNLRNSGNEPLKISGIAATRNIFEAGERTDVAPGGAGSISLVYVGERPGPVDERVTLVTNDALQRTLAVQIKGYVARNWLPDRAVVVYPVGVPPRYDAAQRGYRLVTTIENRSGKEVGFAVVDGSPEALQRCAADVVVPGKKSECEVIYPVNVVREGPVSGTVEVRLILPVEIR